MTLAGPGQAGDGATPSPAGMGLLTGRLTRGPTSPVGGPGIKPAEAPAPGIKLLIFNPARQEIAAVTADTAGHYRLPLPPGPYLIELAPGQGRVFSKDLPARVVITPGQETRLNLRLDTGLR
ncbi:MAG TPA: carboxypeptidase-like regulatory domain-containing protein [Desulfobaccales bacterium]